MYSQDYGADSGPIGHGALLLCHLGDCEEVEHGPETQESPTAQEDVRVVQRTEDSRDERALRPPIVVVVSVSVECQRVPNTPCFSGTQGSRR